MHTAEEARLRRSAPTKDPRRAVSRHNVRRSKGILLFNLGSVGQYGLLCCSVPLQCSSLSHFCPSYQLSNSFSVFSLFSSFLCRSCDPRRT
jgi:hypothetical protein